MHFLKKYAAENEKPVVGFTAEALAVLAHYDWPGNVRELENAIERAVIVCRGDAIRAEDLSLAAVVARTDGAPPIPGSRLADLERFAILQTLEHTGGSTSRAAEILGISTRTIQYRLREYQGDARKPEPEDDGASSDDNDDPATVRH
jgi:two-component system response regulator HydG